MYKILTEYKYAAEQHNTHWITSPFLDINSNRAKLKKSMHKHDIHDIMIIILSVF